jgi:uncharacterized protein DUF6114
MRALIPALVTCVGGAFITLGGLVLAVFGTVLAQVFGFGSAVFLIGLVIGLLTVGVGILLWLLPRAKTALGVAAILFAALSIPFAFGGFVVGFLLTLIGGTMAVVARPMPRVSATAVPPGAAPPWT